MLAPSQHRAQKATLSSLASVSSAYLYVSDTPKAQGKQAYETHIPLDVPMDARRRNKPNEIPPSARCTRTSGNQ